jgi:hypothetical protein
MPGFVNHRARYKIGTFATARGLAEGYKEILAGIYSPKIYYERVKAFSKNISPWKREDGTSISGPSGIIFTTLTRLSKRWSSWG